MENDLIIIAIKYEEPEYEQTMDCILKTKLPFTLISRNPLGIGSLSDAINRGIKSVNTFKYGLIVTNILFDEKMPFELLESLKLNGLVGIQPTYESDHIHLRNDGSDDVKIVPFMELTCALFDLDVMRKYPLDEDMKYWGMDLDMSYRLWQDGYKIGVHHGLTIDHTYIRHSLRKGNRFTRKRYELRKKNDDSTRKALKKKYGTEWRDVIFPRTTEQIASFYRQVKKKVFQLETVDIKTVLETHGWTSRCYDESNSFLLIFVSYQLSKEDHLIALKHQLEKEGFKEKIEIKL